MFAGLALVSTSELVLAPAEHVVVKDCVAAGLIYGQSIVTESALVYDPDDGLEVSYLY